MTTKENELIEKAKRILDEIGIDYKGYTIKIGYEVNDLILEMKPSEADVYEIFFSSEIKFGRRDLISVSVDRKTHKLKMVTTKYNMYEVPNELS
jgi:hypothetical protein